MNFEKLYAKYVTPYPALSFRSLLQNDHLRESIGTPVKDWPALRDKLLNRMMPDVALKVLPPKVLPSSSVKFFCESGLSEDIICEGFKFWGQVYLHGKLNDKFDLEGRSPGDLVSASVDMYLFPLGMTLVQVEGIDSILYLWEEGMPVSYTDSQYNSYLRVRRYGLIVSVDDDVSIHRNAYDKFIIRTNWL